MDSSLPSATALSPKQVSAVLVTKGDIDMGYVLASLRPHFDDIVVWDNSVREDDLKVYGRYAAIAEAKHAVIYTQDDDCILDPSAIVAQYEAGSVVCNMPEAKRTEYRALAPRAGLVGWGSCFDRGLADCLNRYINRHGKDDLFLRECDRVFTKLNSLKLVDVRFNDLPWAHSIDRMGSERRHLGDLAEITRRIDALPRIATND